MITIQRERFEDAIEDLTPLLARHWREIAEDKDEVPLSPGYDIYCDLDSGDKLLFVTVRNDEVLLGYFIGILGPGLHYQETFECHMDIAYVDPEIRRTKVGYKLFQFVEDELKKIGVKRWFVNSKLKHDLSSFYEKLGFSAIETVHSKML